MQNSHQMSTMEGESNHDNWERIYYYLFIVIIAYIVSILNKIHLGLAKLFFKSSHDYSVANESLYSAIFLFICSSNFANLGNLFLFGFVSK